TLQDGHLLAIGVDNPRYAADLDALVQELRQLIDAPLLPVYCGSLDGTTVSPRVRVVFGEILTSANVAPDPTAFQAGQPIASGIQTGSSPLPPIGITLDDCRTKIHELGERIRENDDIAGSDHH